MNARPATGADSRGGHSGGTDVVRAAFAPGPRMAGKLEKPKNARATLARLVDYFGRFRLVLLAVAACVVVYTALGLVGPYLMGVALDRFISRGDAAGLSRIAAVMLGAYVLNAAFQVVASWSMAGVSQRALEDLRRDLFGHLQALPLSFFDPAPPGS